jgi:hypothetical protein
MAESAPPSIIKSPVRAARSRSGRTAAAVIPIAAPARHPKNSFLWSRS